MARFPFEAATRDALLHLLDTAPRFGATDSPRTVAATACSAAADLFEAELAVLLRVLDERHAVVEARVPSTVLMPPGRAFPLSDLPGLGEPAARGDGRDGPTLLATGNAVRVPLSGDDQFGYVLVLQWEQEVRLEPELMLALQRFGDRAGLALERAERRDAEADARHNSAQTQRLLALSASLAAARTVDEVAGALLAEGRQQLKADTVRVHMLEKGRLQPLVHDVASAPAPQRSDDTGGPTAEALERNVIVLVESPAARAERYPELDSTAATGASATVPLSAGSAVVGIVELLFGEWRDFDAADREFLAAFGRQGGVALERARLQAEEHSIATRLQRELLPLRLPVVPGLVHAVEYHAGAELMDVGGDWYDVVQLGPSLVALTVGDVVGKGVAAAGVMGRLRSALRALALAFEQPQQVIAHLERYAATIEGADVATVWYGTLELQRGLLRHLSAGHPPVLVASPGGEARFLTEGRSAPLCVPLDEPRPWADTQLERGETLLLYSDGLVERRDQLLDARLDLLVEEVRALDGLPPAELAPGLVATMAAGSPATDDVVVVAVRYEGA